MGAGSHIVQRNYPRLSCETEAEGEHGRQSALPNPGATSESARKDVSPPAAATSMANPSSNHRKLQGAPSL